MTLSLFGITCLVVERITRTNENDKIPIGLVFDLATTAKGTGL